MALVQSIEWDDLTTKGLSLKNRIGYDATGLKFLVALGDPIEMKRIHKWDLKYPAKVYQLEEEPNLEKLRNLMASWQNDVSLYYPKKKYPQLLSPTLEELFGFAECYGFIKNFEK